MLNGIWGWIFWGVIILVVLALFGINLLPPA
jgi:hypothetical protein